MIQDSIDFYKVIKERRAVRYYDSSVKISDEEIKELIREATLAPSANNLQSWRFMVITDPALKQKLLPIAFNQQQVVDASAVIMVFGDKNAFKAETGEEIYRRAVEAGYMTEENKNKMLNMMKDFYGSRSEQALKEILIFDGGLVSMQLMLAAKARGYDTVPMTGYDVEAFRKAFEVPDHLVNILMIALGKAEKPGHPTVRYDVGEITYWNTIS